MGVERKLGVAPWDEAISINFIDMFLIAQRLTYTEAVDILRMEHEKCRKFEFEPRVSDNI